MVMLDDVFREVATAERDLVERQIPAGRIGIEPTGLVADDEQFRLDDAGFERFCKRVGAPGRYLAGLDRGISAAVLRYHLEHGDLGDGRVTLITRRDKFIAFVRDDLARLSGQQVFNAVVDGIGDASAGLYASDLSVSDESVTLNLLSHEAATEVEPGDLIEAGLRIAYSPIGEWATRVESYLLRLVCTNGMVHRECASSRAVRTRRLPASHPEAIDLQIAQVKRLAEQAWGKLTEKLNAVGDLRNQQIEVEPFFRRWMQRARLSPRNLLPVLLRAWEEEGGEPTAYSAFNAMTRTGTHNLALSPRQREVLQRLAGLIATHNIHICPRCFSLVSGD